MKCNDSDCEKCDPDDMPNIYTRRHGNGNYTAYSPTIPFLVVRDKSHRRAFEAWMNYWESVIEKRN